jgi:uncharacterized protein involved in exopolysaccharide biosynthesis
MLKRWWWVLLVMTGIGPILGLLTAAVVTHVRPKKYESRAVIEVRPRMQLIDDVAYDSRDLTGFYRSEASMIESRHSLSKVIERLDLANQWRVDRETALQMLFEMVTTEELKGRDVIAIRVRCPDKQAARDIALEVVRCHRDYRNERETRELERALEELKKAVAEQEKMVEERRRILAEIVRTKGVRVAQSDEEDAERDLEAEQEMAEKMKLMVLQETISSKMPDDGLLALEEPVVPRWPVSPNVPLNLILGTALGLLLSLPLGLLVIRGLERLLPRPNFSSSRRLLCLW